MDKSAVTIVLVPGAWMGSWIWEPTVARLRLLGHRASTLTLRGLEPEAANAPDSITLAEHVRQVRDVVASCSEPVLLVGHSYSGLVVGQVADQAPDRVVGVVYLGGFIPRDGESLLDAWGSSQSERNDEAAAIAADGNLWLPPTSSMLSGEPDLESADCADLAERFRPHPGLTVTDPAVMSRDAQAQPATYVALSAEGSHDAWAAAPREAHQASRWRRRFLPTGHWPMVSAVDDVVSLLAEEAQHYAANSQRSA